MGVDKAGIRTVYHHNLSKSLENYARKIGRAGRDGQDSHCEVFACASDASTLENFPCDGTPTPGAVAALVHELLGQGATFDVSTCELSQKHDIRPLAVETLPACLELEGVMEATGAFFSEVKFQLAQPSAEILARFDADCAAFPRRIFRQARKATTWFTLDVAAASRASGEFAGGSWRPCTTWKNKGASCSRSPALARDTTRTLTRPIRTAWLPCVRPVLRSRTPRHRPHADRGRLCAGDRLPDPSLAELLS